MPSPETRALYESKSTDDLRYLKEAFERDKARAFRSQTIVFVDERLALIAEVLAARKEQVRRERCPVSISI